MAGPPDAVKTGSLLTSAPLVEIAIAVAVLCFVSMLIGLAISTLVTKSEQTMPALVVVTMIQVVAVRRLFPLTGAIRWVSSIAPARWGMGALASTTQPERDHARPGPADALWQHTPVQWLTDIGFMILIGLICLAITQWRLGKLGPGHRK